jgi:hypothetical protein
VPKTSSISIKGLKELPGRYMDENVTKKITAYSAAQEDEVMAML